MANSHQRDNDRPTLRAVVIAGPLAAMATASAVTLGVIASTPSESNVRAESSASALAADLGSVADRGETVSRSADRKRARAIDRGLMQKARQKSVKPPEPTRAEKILDPEATKKALKQADQELYSTTLLNIWTKPGKKGVELGELKSGKQVTVTGRSLFGRDEIAFRGKSRWVTSGYLSAEKPEPEPEPEPEDSSEPSEPSAGASLGGACTNGTSTSGGANVQAVHDAVCAAFPEIRTYGGLRGGGGDHSVGRAVDISISGARGQEVADFVRANASALGVSYVIYSQQIWSVQRGGEGWRGMSDRGSTTANHYDHVHVSTF